MLQALRSRNYRLFFGGQIVSLAGTWITTTATSWLVYRLTGSAAAARPGRLRRAVSGVSLWARSPASSSTDWDRRRLLVVTQTVSMLQSFALAALTLGGRSPSRRSSSSSVVQGIVNAFDMPGRAVVPRSR